MSEQAGLYLVWTEVLLQIRPSVVHIVQEDHGYNREGMSIN